MDPNDQNQPGTDQTPVGSSDDSAGNPVPSDSFGTPPSAPTDPGMGHQEEELPPPPPAVAPDAPTPAQEGSEQDGDAGSPSA